VTIDHHDSQSKPRTVSNDNQVLVSYCRDCNARWFGSIACHCSQCHQTFALITAFDAHFESPIDESPMVEDLAEIAGSFPAEDGIRVCIPAADLPAEGFILERMTIWTRR
jgi:hypothetical protein